MGAWRPLTLCDGMTGMMDIYLEQRETLHDLSAFAECEASGWGML